MNFKLYQTGCLFGANLNENSEKWECRTPKEYIKNIKYDASDSPDIIMTLMQERDPKLFEDSFRYSSRTTKDGIRPKQ